MKQLGIPYTGPSQLWSVLEYDPIDWKISPIKDFIRSFQNKIEKLNKGQYMMIQQYDLFVLSQIWVCESILPQILQELKSRNIGNQIYTYVYLFALEKIYFFDLKTLEYDMFSYDKQPEWAKMAYNMANNI